MIESYDFSGLEEEEEVIASGSSAATAATSEHLSQGICSTRIIILINFYF